jgi:hypothetical protein
MRRLGRFLAYLGLALAVPTAAMWVRSVFLLDQVQWDPDPRPYHEPGKGEPWVVHGQYDVRTAAGGLMIFWGDLHQPAGSYRKPTGRSFSWVVEENPEYPNRDIAIPNQRVFLRFAGFSILTDGWSFPSGHARKSYLIVPLWFPLAVLATPGVIMLGRDLRRRRRTRAGLCVACGYDLRSTPGRCPECGLSISST